MHVHVVIGMHHLAIWSVSELQTWFLQGIIYGVACKVIWFLWLLSTQHPMHLQPGSYCQQGTKLLCEVGTQCPRAGSFSLTQLSTFEDTRLELRVTIQASYHTPTYVLVGMGSPERCPTDPSGSTSCSERGLTQPQNCKQGTLGVAPYMPCLPAPPGYAQTTTTLPGASLLSLMNQDSEGLSIIIRIIITSYFSQIVCKMLITSCFTWFEPRTSVTLQN